ncbi:hypothetical protein [Thermococcus sp. GR6]|uniref:hypothetical protein n=1 Tax=Thermococcus sp. GR6 TaxID=1638256 RepID=UPI001431913F|nr:hypothetical protein [Thermococcus sp. GR6]NJE42174.1 hypothetical protein [Thermococcus sp. GR6]
MSLVETVVGSFIGVGLGFLFGIVVLIYGAAKKQLGRGLVGFLLNIIGGLFLGMAHIVLAIFGPIVITAILIRWIAGKSEGPEPGSSETETEGKRKPKYLKYIAGAVGVLIILMLVVGSGANSNSGAKYHYTCPADKYLLANEDFDESGWKVKDVSESDVDVYLSKYGELNNYECMATGRVFDLSISFAPATYNYGIYVFNNEEQAQMEFNSLKQMYLKEGSIDTCSLGDNCFSYTLMSGGWVWIQENNVIVGIFGAGLGSDESSTLDFGKRVLDKMHRVG